MELDEQAGVGVMSTPVSSTIEPVTSSLVQPSQFPTTPLLMTSTNQKGSADLLNTSRPTNPMFASATAASDVPTPIRTPAPAAAPDSMDSGERESLRLALALQSEEERYIEAQREGAARLAQIEAEREDDDQAEDIEDEDEEEELDESLALAWRLQQEEDDRALFIALNGGREPPPGTLPRNVSPSQMTFDELTQLGENIGKVSKGASKSAIDDLPTCTFAESHRANAIVGEQCAICRVEYKDDDVLRVLPCRHAEHADCE